MSVEQTSMNQLITDNIDVWTSTVKAKSSSGRGSSKKRELYGVKKLRELILELAVRGKLVPQDSTDEPSSVLLERIAEEKAQLVKEKKIKKPKNLPEISDEEKSFVLPVGWEWAHLQDLTTYVQRGKGPKYAESGSVQVVSQKCVQNSGFDLSPARYVTDESLEKYQEERYLQDNDILWNSTGTGTVGRANVITNIPEKRIVADSHVTVIRPTNFYSRFLWCFIMAPGVQARIQPDHENALVSGSTKQVELNTSSVVSVIVPVAPLKEQHRIVAKVDELMTLCDQLEQQTEASIEAHQVLVATLLDTLTNSADADELMQNWQMVAEHFDTLFTTEESIDQLKQTILQLAVMGKLVPQDPNDEPAAKLLERIAEEKAQLIKDKKIKKQKALPPIADDEKLFGLANGWCFVRLDDICTGVTSGSTPPKDKFIENEGVPYLKVYNIRNQKIDFSYKEQFVDSAHHTTKLTRSILYPGDVVMNIVGPPLGKIAIIPDSYPEWNCNQAIVVFRPIESLLNKYIYTYLTAGLFLQSIELIGTAGQDNISVTKSRSIVLPMPPLEEQHRIFARVEELMVVCDELKARLKKSQTTQLNFTDAIVEQAV
ncbi:restriction endonuclease subunit S [Vibrio sp. 10N.222.49.B4]|uniref:restriction endonuclease subunit S n=1 Tax=Vibrio sp. 10N.222.49.B4 TaxID=3229613 RepID=UPI0035528C4D